RGKGVVGHLADPGQVPERLVKLLGGALQLQEVEPEAWALSEPLADRILGLAVGAVELHVPGRWPREPDVLAEVQGDLAVASAERTGADPDQLPARAELVEPGRAVRAEAARQHVPLPCHRRERDALQWDQCLPEAVSTGATAAVGVHVLPARQEASELALVGRLDLLSQPRQAGAPEPAQDVRLTPLASGAAGQEL